MRSEPGSERRVDHPSRRHGGRTNLVGVVAYSGERYRAFGDCVKLLEPQEYSNWPSGPPRTTQFLFKEIAKLGVRSDGMQ